ncbi:hypothetical protein [Rhizobium chutanense]|nr:hypothetical protein [Rhizobium chutanense]
MRSIFRGIVVLGGGLGLAGVAAPPVSVIYVLGFLAAVVLLHALGKAFARSIVSIDDGYGPIATRTDGGFTAFSGLGVGAGVL